jgi:hypothetical protein
MPKVAIMSLPSPAAGRVGKEGKVKQHIPDVLEGNEYPVRVVLRPWETLGLTEDQGRLDESELTRIVHDKNRYAHDCERNADPAQQPPAWHHLIGIHSTSTMTSNVSTTAG